MIIGSDSMMFFSGPGKYEACGLYTIGHLILGLITVIAIILALKYTKKENVKKIIRNCTIFVWLYEIVIIVFKVSTGGVENVNNYLPLYYCSMLLYAGLLSSFGKGKLKRMGDVFLATGGIIGGALYLIYPITSIATYPAFHLVSTHSFIFHGIMLYIGILMHLTSYIELEKKDIKYYFFIICIISIVSYIINQIFDSNLMFISKNFPGNVIINTLYKTTGKFFPLIMIIGQATLPFYLVYGFKKEKKQEIINDEEKVLLCDIAK